MLLNVQGIEKYYGDRLIFKLDTLKIYSGDKIGIVGCNGAGKSTLLKLLAGIIAPDKGKIDIKAKVAYADQLSEESEQPDNIQAEIFKTKNTPKSGGEIMRKKLAAAFSVPFDILALDEPTSNLDTDGIQTLNSVLGGIETLLLISHDRQLLDNHCNKIIEVADGRCTVFSGGWSEYQQSAQTLRQRQESLYDEYVHEKKRLERAIKETGERASKMKKAPSRMGNSEARLHKRETTAKQAKVLSAGSSILSRLEKLEEVEKPKEIRLIKPDFLLTDPPQNKIILSCGDLNFSYGDNVIFRSARLEIQNGRHIAVIGANGLGKTTLLKLIHQRPDIVYRVPKAKIGYLSQNFSNLIQGISILENIMDTAVQSQTICRNCLANMGFKGDDVYKKINMLSGGELIKVSLSKLIVSDCNMLILDEPTNYLDIDSVIQVQNAIINYEGTVVFVSHDSGFVKAVANKVLEIKNKEILEADYFLIKK